jgi:hypothetical protein
MLSKPVGKQGGVSVSLLQAPDEALTRRRAKSVDEHHHFGEMWTVWRIKGDQLALNFQALSPANFVLPLDALDRASCGRVHGRDDVQKLHEL